MRKIIKATVLTLALAIPAWAGEIGAPIAPPSGDIGNPLVATSSTGPTKTGDMGYPIDATDVGLTLLQSLLTLL
ncbi:MAG TPA: hypothetical protein VGC91_20855 [Pyrinomonadaceae bacterium]|jgi:hypothetical protein